MSPRRVEPANASPEADLPLFAALKEAPASVGAFPPLPVGQSTTPAPWSNPTTSRAAAAEITPHLGDLEALVLRTIQAGKPGHAPGMTCDEVEEATGLSHQTASARINGLRAKGRVEDSNVLRRTRSGRNAIVWRAK